MIEKQSFNLAYIGIKIITIGSEISKDSPPLTELSSILLSVVQKHSYIILDVDVAQGVPPTIAEVTLDTPTVSIGCELSFVEYEGSFPFLVNYVYVN